MPQKPKVGDTLYLMSAMPSVRVEKVGRKWITLEDGIRVSAGDWRIDGAYPVQFAFKDEAHARRHSEALRLYRMMISGRGGGRYLHVDVTPEDVIKADGLLGPVI